ncbi:hypothetical protein H6784_03090 [Candidatus Nomurabacteria bacterium]|nr:hypothetical protein [Candidatus Kaiserbacteria bacterium]MCB9814379.1 hypothetical protein [Candidatus Nomurabacteria bacterium]
MTKKYSSNYSSLITIICAHVAILLISYLERGGFDIELDSLTVSLLVAPLLLAWWLDQKTWLKITGSELISSGQFDFRGSEKVPIHNVKEVRRVRQNILISNFGSFMAFYGDDGPLMQVREANYSLETIKRFMTDLKEKLPFATFDPQYEELIIKNVNELSEFKRTPATHDNF